MKNRASLLLLTICTSILCLAATCENKACEKSCAQGECLDGECICEAGYYSYNCDYEGTNSLPGNYEVQVIRSLGDSTIEDFGHLVEVISSDPATYEFVLINVFNQSDTLRGTLDRGVFFPLQVTFAGGNFEGGAIPLRYTEQEIRIDLFGTWTLTGEEWSVDARLRRQL